MYNETKTNQSKFVKNRTKNSTYVIIHLLSYFELNLMKSKNCVNLKSMLSSFTSCSKPIVVYERFEKLVISLFTILNS